MISRPKPSAKTDIVIGGGSDAMDALDPQGDEGRVPLRLTVAQYQALQATARGEVHRTHTTIAYTITGPASSKVLWAIARAGLITDSVPTGQHGRHQMVVTAKGRAAMEAVTSAFDPNETC
jgi:hypothetical protein